MKKFLYTAIAAFAMFSVPAFAGDPATVDAPTHDKLTPYEKAVACLEDVSIEHKGKTYHLKEYDESTGKGHFRPYTSDDPDVVLAGGISIVKGLIDGGSPWASKKDDIQDCLKMMPNLKLLGSDS